MGRSIAGCARPCSCSCSCCSSCSCSCCCCCCYCYRCSCHLILSYQNCSSVQRKITMLRRRGGSANGDHVGRERRTRSPRSRQQHVSSWEFSSHTSYPKRQAISRLGVPPATIPSWSDHNDCQDNTIPLTTIANADKEAPEGSRRLPEGSLEISRRCPEGSRKVPRKFPVSFLEFLQADVRADVVAKLAADPPQNSQMPSDASGGYIRSMYAASTRQVRSECAAGQRVRGRYAAGTRKYPAHMLLLLLFMFRIVPEIS